MQTSVSGANDHYVHDTLIPGIREAPVSPALYDTTEDKNLPPHLGRTSVEAGCWLVCESNQTQRIDEDDNEEEQEEQQQEQKAAEHGSSRSSSSGAVMWLCVRAAGTNLFLIGFFSMHKVVSIGATLAENVWQKKCTSTGG